MVSNAHSSIRGKVEHEKNLSLTISWSFPRFPVDSLESEGCCKFKKRGVNTKLFQKGAALLSFLKSFCQGDALWLLGFPQEKTKTCFFMAEGEAKVSP